MAKVSFDKVLDLMGDDKEMLLEMLQVFSEDIPIAVNKIKEAWESNNHAAMKEPAHKLKSSITWLNLMKTYDCLQFLENFAQQGGDVKQAEACVKEVVLNAENAVIDINKKMQEINES